MLARSLPRRAATDPNGPMCQSLTPYFEDFGVAAGVATDNELFPIPADSRYVIAVIPEPGTLLQVGLAALRLRRG